MQIEYILLSRDSSIDAETGQLSVFSFFENINVQAKAPIAIPIHMIVHLTRGEEIGELDLKFGLTIQSPANEIVKQQEIAMKMPADRSDICVRFNSSMNITVPGRYYFNLFQVGAPQVQKSRSLGVNLITPLENSPKAEQKPQTKKKEKAPPALKSVKDESRPVAS